MKKSFYLKKIKRRKGVVYLYRLNRESGVVDSDEQVFHSTGQPSKARAEHYVLKRIEELKKKHLKPGMSGVTFRQYADPFFLWDKCPHIRRLLDEGKSIRGQHAKNQRRLLVNYVFKDPVVERPFSNITRAELIDFRSRLRKKIPDQIPTVNKVMGVIKTIFREAMYREEIDRDPTFGLGNIKEEQKSSSIFALQELQLLFPEDSFGPWKDIRDYTCFLLAASTGMRRGEILALAWENIHLEEGFVNVVRAWKDLKEIGAPKWDHVRSVPFLLFSDRIVRRLEELKEQSIRIAPDDLVFCYDDGSRFGNTWWKKRFFRAMEKAEIDRQGRGLSPHSFRHTLNTLLRDRGKDDAKICEVLGWRQRRTQENYTHFDIEHFKDLRID